MKKLATVSTLVLGVLAAPSFASAQTPATSVTIVDDATLLAKGGGVLVPIEYTCDRHDAIIIVALTQRAGNKFAFGDAKIIDSNCPFNTVVSQDVVVPMKGEAKFKAGPAIAQALMTACALTNPTACSKADDAKEIQIHK